MPPVVRSLVGVVAAVGVAWVGSLILGEYPFTGYVPILGGLLLGVVVVSAQGFVEQGEPPVWAVVAGAGAAAWGMWRAAWIDAGGIGPLPWEAWAAMAAAGAGALFRLVPKPSRDREEPAGGEPG